MAAARKIYLARPCVEDPTLFIAESSFNRKLDMEMVCSILREINAPETRCSTRLGVARFRLDDCQVMLYRNGRIDIRRVSSISEASNVMDRVESLISTVFSDPGDQN